MNFDHVAGYYDRLARWVFGGEWLHTQLLPLQALSEANKLLIIGGGTGSILEYLPEIEVTYVELSEKMLSKARKRSTNAQVFFVQQDFRNWMGTESFDAIYCPFVLDCFTVEELKEILRKISAVLATGGQLHVLDFHRGNGLQNVLIKGMIVFFKVFSGLQINQLAAIDATIRGSGFDCTSSKGALHKRVFYNRYQKR